MEEADTPALASNARHADDSGWVESAMDSEVDKVAVFSIHSSLF